MRISDWSSDVCSSDLSKSWDEFSGPDAPKLDFIFTVCDNAAGETCPAWPGKPMTAHWGIEDTAAVEGPGQREAFERALHYLSHRISLFLALPHESIDELAMARRMKEIGGIEGDRKSTRLKSRH